MVVAVCLIVVPVYLRKKRKTQIFFNIRRVPLPPRITFDNDSGDNYHEPSSSVTGDRAHERGGPPASLRNASNTAAVAATSRLPARLSLRKDWSKGRARLRKVSDADVITASLRASNRSTPNTDRPTTGSHLGNSADTKFGIAS